MGGPAGARRGLNGHVIAPRAFANRAKGHSWIVRRVHDLRLIAAAGNAPLNPLSRRLPGCAETDIRGRVYPTRGNIVSNVGG
jgi:hypothetical protein